MSPFYIYKSNNTYTTESNCSYKADAPITPMEIAERILPSNDFDIGINTSIDTNTQKHLIIEKIVQNTIAILVPYLSENLSTPNITLVKITPKNENVYQPILKIINGQSTTYLDVLDEKIIDKTAFLNLLQNKDNKVKFERIHQS